MKSTPLTQGIAMLVLVIYVLYSFFVLPFAGFLLSMAVGLVSYGGLESFEMSVSLMIITGVMYSLIAKSSEREATARLTTTRPRVEPFEDLNSISKRVQSIQKQHKEVSGVFASGFVEGFANADDDPENPNGSGSTMVTSGTGGPATATGTGGAGSDMDAPMPPPSITTSGPKEEKEEDEISGFTGSQNKGNTKGEFKLGVLPEETKGGYHIDQGTTVMNALNALKPDQIKAMSADTQKLIDTQKSLMSMLSTMKPMLQDGQQMMNNFQEMFGKSGGQFKLA